MVTIPTQMSQRRGATLPGEGGSCPHAALGAARSYKCRQQNIPTPGARPSLRAHGDTSRAVKLLLQELLVNAFNTELKKRYCLWVFPSLAKHAQGRSLVLLQV